MYVRTLHPRAGGLLAIGVLLLLGVTGSSMAEMPTDPPQMLRNPGLDPFNPGLPAPYSTWRGVFPSDDSMTQEGYVDDGNGIIDELDQIKLRGVWFPILSTTPVLTVVLPVLCSDTPKRCPPSPPDHFLATVDPFPLTDLIGTEWTYIAPNTDPATWPTCIVESWIDSDSNGIVSLEDYMILTGPGVQVEGFVVGVHLSISIPGLPPIANETTSWGALKSLFGP